MQYQYIKLKKKYRKIEIYTQTQICEENQISRTHSQPGIYTHRLS